MKITTTYIITLLIFIMGNSISFAQLQKANQYFDNYTFNKAIPLYEKLYKKDTTDVDIIIKLGKCFQSVKDYHNAEIYYTKALQYKKDDPTLEEDYIEILKNTGKLSDARAQAINLARKKKNDVLMQTYQNSYEELNLWKSNFPQYDITNLTSINTQDAEFSPVVFNNDLVFIGEKKSDYVNSIEYGWTGRLYLSINYAEREKADTFKIKKKAFPNSINNDTHNGPICFNKKGTEAIFTRVIKTKDKDNEIALKPQLFRSQFDGKKWHKPVSFEQNNESYVFEHPTLSSDSKTLYFISDMDGGFGGTDIYSCKKENDIWSNPQNLGSIINTSKDEKFPYIHTDGTLYFSSNGHNSYGGLDIFSSSFNENKWEEPVNLKTPINSSTDDFGITFLDSIYGYFSSNRPGGVGSDDIYKFKQLKVKTTIKGALTFDNAIPGRSIRIKIMDKNNEEIKAILTQPNGDFEMNEVPAHQSYYFSIDDEMANSKTARIYLSSNGGKVIELTPSEQSMFNFQALTVEQYNNLEILTIEEEGELSKDIWGKIYKKLPGDIPTGLKIQLVNDDGEIVYTVVTDNKGTFLFEDLPTDMNFIVGVKEYEEELKMVFINKEDGAVNKAMKIGTGQFMLQQIVEDITTTSQKGFYGKLYKKLPGDIPAGLMVQIVNDDGEILFTTYTDANGNFRFNELPSDVNYIVKINSQDEDELKLLFLDKEGKMTGAALKTDKGFEFKEHKQILTTSSPELKGKVFSKLSGGIPQGLTVQIVNDDGKILFSTVTDNNGNFKFSNLSSDMNYVIKINSEDNNDIQMVFINEEGKFEKIAHKTDNGLYTYEATTDEETPQTALIGQVYRKMAGDISGGLEIQIINDDGDILYTTITNSTGNFQFENLPTSNNYIIKINSEDNSDMQLAFLSYEEAEFADISQQNDNGLYVYELSEQKQKDNLTITGQFFNKLSSSIPSGLEVYLVNDEGDILYMTVADDKGSFNFRNLPQSQHYILKIGENDANLNLLLYDEQGMITDTVNTNADGSFIFKKHSPKKGKKITSVPKTLTTQEELVKQDILPATQEEPIKKENLVAVSDIPETKEKPIEQEKLATVPTPIETKIKTKETKNEIAEFLTNNSSLFSEIYYEFDEWEITTVAAQELDKLVVLMQKNELQRVQINSYTDIWGNFSYNQLLSEKRAQTILKYLVKKGISKERIIAKGYGETHLANNCTKNVWCPPEEHAKNRRTEISLLK